MLDKDSIFIMFRYERVIFKGYDNNVIMFKYLNPIFLIFRDTYWNNFKWNDVFEMGFKIFQGRRVGGMGPSVNEARFAVS